MSANAAPADVDQPRPGRIGPREAAQLAAGARIAGVTCGSARVVLELLLRHTRGSIAVERSTRWIAANTGPSRSTIIRAIHALVSAGLVVVAIPGTGRTVTSYLVNVEVLRILTLDSSEVTPMTLTVHPGESADSDATPGVSKRHPRGIKTPPQGYQNATPVRACMRARPALYSLPTRKTPLPLPARRHHRAGMLPPPAAGPPSTKPETSTSGAHTAAPSPRADVEPAGPPPASSSTSASG